MSNVLHTRITRHILDRFLSRRLIENVWRGHYVESLIYFALCKQWKLSDEWEVWDLRNDFGARLEVKQSAALQTWTAPGRASSPKFSIEPKTGYWTTDNEWIERPGRYADVYVFAWHPEADKSIADHRKAEQWKFYVVPENKLPIDQKTISLNPIKALSQEHSYLQLAAAIDEALETLPGLKEKDFPS